MEPYAGPETLLAQEGFRKLFLWSAGVHALMAALLVWSPVFRSSSIEPVPVFVQVMDAPRAPAAPAAKPVSKPSPPAPAPAAKAAPAPAPKPAPAQQRQKVDEIVLPAKPKDLPKAAPKPEPPAPTAQELLDRMRAKAATQAPTAPTAQELLDRMRANAAAAAVDPAASAAAAASGSGRFDPEMAAYHRKIQTLLFANWVGANQFRHQPELRASFEVRVQPDGRIRAVRLLRSSGNRFYDESAERAILKSEPLPTPPRGEITLSLTFNPMEIL